MDPRKIKWIKDGFRKNLSFLLVVVIVSMFSIITANFILIIPTDSNQQIVSILRIVYALAILVIAAIALVAWYTNDFVHGLDRLLLHECVPRDITVLNIKKSASFGPHSEIEGCKIIETREFRNNMPHDYNRYLFSHRMSHAPPTFDKFKYYVDNEKTPRNYSIEDLNYEQDEPQSRDPDVLKYKVEYKFPIQAKPHETRKMRVEYPTHSFKDALNGKIDWIEHDVNAITEKLQLEIKLVDGLELDYYIDYPSHPKDNDGARYDIEVRDYSRQRMWNSEFSLKNENIMPIFSENMMKWIIYHPKIGYKYRVYFTLKKKVETATSTQSSLPDT